MVYKMHLSPILHNKIWGVNVRMFEKFIFNCIPVLIVKTIAIQLENLHTMKELDSRAAASK